GTAGVKGIARSLVHRGGHRGNRERILFHRGGRRGRGERTVFTAETLSAPSTEFFCVVRGEAGIRVEPITPAAFSCRALPLLPQPVAPDQNAGASSRREANTIMEGCWRTERTPRPVLEPFSASSARSAVK